MVNVTVSKFSQVVSLPKSVPTGFGFVPVITQSYDTVPEAEGEKTTSELGSVGSVIVAALASPEFKDQTPDSPVKPGVLALKLYVPGQASISLPASAWVLSKTVRTTTCSAEKPPAEASQVPFKTNSYVPATAPIILALAFTVGFNSFITTDGPESWVQWNSAEVPLDPFPIKISVPTHPCNSKSFAFTVHLFEH